jgi:hypothetical protein
MTEADQRRVSKALQGLEFPATKEQILRYAEERDVHDKTLQGLLALPDVEFATSQDAERSIPQEPEKHT